MQPVNAAEGAMLAGQGRAHAQQNVSIGISMDCSLSTAQEASVSAGCILQKAHDSMMLADSLTQAAKRKSVHVQPQPLKLPRPQSLTISFAILLQGLLQMPQLLLEFCLFPVLCAIQDCNASWRMCSKHCNGANDVLKLHAGRAEAAGTQGQ